MPSPIEHVVLIIKENHSFDNYFGDFPGAHGLRMPPSPNPPTQDPNHRHAAWLTRRTTAPRLQFRERDIPAYFAYAQQFTHCNNYFTDVAGPSTPNHLMLICGDSPIIDNAPRYRTPSGSLFALGSLPAALEKARKSWGNYGGYAFAYVRDLASRPVRPSARFKTDALAGNLPAVSWVYAPHAASEHPPEPSDEGKAGVGDVTVGMRWTVDQVNAVVQGGLWNKTAIFITWDDWGGWYDHVEPPLVETWKADGTPFRYGSRVGCLVLSPYAKKGYISKTLLSHVSLLKFCQTLFHLPSWQTRVQAAKGMSDCFNVAQPPAPPPHARSL